MKSIFVVIFLLSTPVLAVADEQPPDVVGQNGKILKSPTQTPTPPSEENDFPLPSTPQPTPIADMKDTTPIPTETPSPTPVRDKNQKKTPIPANSSTPTVSPTPNIKLPWVTTIPNPAWGDKVIFRIIVKGSARAHIVIYDRFFSKIKELDGEGTHLFDILWSLKKIPQGIYHYQTQLTDTESGESQILHMQSFAVMRDENPLPDP